MTNDAYVKFAERNSDEYDSFLGGPNAIADIQSALRIKLGGNMQTLLQEKLIANKAQEG